jgi:oligopeptide transport system substrate-binding protein
MDIWAPMRTRSSAINLGAQASAMALRATIGFVVVALVLLTAAPALAAPMPKHGGAAVITFSNDLTTLDPQVGYDWQNWSVIKSIFDGLMDYKPGTTELIPDLAESYTVSEDGSTYTFKLREGVKFHNGRPLTASDVKYSLERAVNPATQSPGSGYYSMIKGFDDFIAGRTNSLSGVTIPDDRTVIITLSRPDATFLHLLALNFAHVVPKEEVGKAGAEFGKRPVGTGAFKFIEWLPGRRIVLERNTDYFRKGLPYLDKLTFEFGQDPTIAVLRLHRGEVDIVGDGIPPAQFTTTIADPANKDLIAEGIQLHTGFLEMNVTRPPFDNLKVRQAVNMAINKQRIVRFINNRATPATQIPPPGMPAYHPDIKGYAYDPERAKKLLAEAGFGEITTELYVMNVDPNPRIARAIQQDLAAVGITVELRYMTQTEVIAAGGSGDAPMIWSGGMAWIADFPDPSNFYYGILGCGGAVEGGWNWSKYCNKELDARAAKADVIVRDSEKDARVAEWKAVFDELLKDAPVVPVFNEKRYTYHSARIKAGEGAFTDPTRIPANYDHIFSSEN